MTVDEYLAKVPDPLRDVATAARRVIDEALPAAAGSVWHGHPVWKVGSTPVALLKAYPAYVTFGLFQGQDVADPSGRLVATSRRMAVVKLRAVDEIDATLFDSWLRQAEGLAT